MYKLLNQSPNYICLKKLLLKLLRIISGIILLHESVSQGSERHFYMQFRFDTKHAYVHRWLYDQTSISINSPFVLPWVVS